MSRPFSSAEVPMSHDTQSHYVRTQEYTPGPKYPLSAGLNPALGYFGLGQIEDENDTVVVDNKIFSRETHQFADGDFICPQFFDLASLDGFTRRFKHSQWTYEMRRVPQPILPFLSLGPYSCLRDLELLRSQGFTLLLAIRNRQSAQARLVSGDKAASQLGIQADTIDVLDNQELISAFPRAIRRINDHLAGVDDSSHPNLGSPVTGHSSSRRRVLVFCESGNERSAAVVIAYIMVMLNLDPVRATHAVQQHRFCVSIEDPMKRILASFESILMAKRDVERAKHVNMQSGAATLAPPPVPPVLLAKKRSFADRQEHDNDLADHDMDIDDEGHSSMDRMPRAPFQDRVA
ncbi:Serine/threonine/tyrosine-interacting protein [Penicillium rolfsii]|nr:Serine/threonine/tyrosine-interacting protein [Penicillium rolfsii]